MSESIDIDRLAQRTQCAFIAIRLLGTPLWCLLCMLVFILYKHAHLTAWQVTVLIALKPTSSLLSPYWSQAIYQRPDKILWNLVGANLLRYIPFLLIPWISSSWFMIAAFGFYMTLTRATIPAWMEMLKFNLPKTKREEVVSYGTTIDYLGTALVSVGAGFALDHHPELWRVFFVCTAGLGILSTAFFAIASFPRPHAVPACVSQSSSWKEKVIRPWQQTWQLMHDHKAFTAFQIGFMLGGAGLMIMQPALPSFFIDTLHLSFVEMGLAIALCKGIGVALTAPLWTRLFRSLDIFQLSALVTLCATLFPFLLFATTWHMTLLYIAYAFYGIMQAGSELTWHMSGLVFAQDKDSSLFSSTNVMTVGVRGCCIPALGALLLPKLHPLGLMMLGAGLCLLASGYFLYYRLRLKPSDALQR